MALGTAALMAVGLVPSRLEGQIIRPGRRVAEPALWISGAGGLLRQQRIVDGSTGTTWEFSSALQWRLSVERPFGQGNAVGLAATMANTPLRYSGNAACNGCDARAQVRQLLAVFRGGGSGTGLHQVIELSAGAIAYSNFRRDADGEALAPTKTDLDPLFAIGYGVGYALSPRLHVAIVQEASTSFHQREGLGGSADRTAQQYTTRLGLRWGLASR